MPSVSPHPTSAPSPASPHGSSGGGRRPPPLTKRHSSQTSVTFRPGLASPGSGGEQQQLQLPVRQHHVKPAKHAKIVLPRNLSSGRNLAKLARQTQVAEQEARAVATAAAERKRSHEADTDIRLPGSLDTSTSALQQVAAPIAPAMRRNLTSGQLPRNTSHTKLKKNLSHGQLSRIGSGRNLVGTVLNASARGPPSPGLKGKSKRPKSIDVMTLEKDLHQQEVELAQQMQERKTKKDGPKRVGFAVGSPGDASDEDETPQMEGSGLQEDEWEDQSGSASPETTRQNTAANSRRTSVELDKPPDRRSVVFQDATNGAKTSKVKSQGTPLNKTAAPASTPPPAAGPAIESEDEEDVDDEGDEEEEDEVDDDDDDDVEEDEDEDEENPPSPMTMPMAKVRIAEQNATPVELERAQQKPAVVHRPEASRSTSGYSNHSNPATKHVLAKSSQSVAPALVSNVNTLDNLHSIKASPTASMVSSRSNIGESAPDNDSGELVSRFIHSTSHPSTGSGNVTVANTPKQNSFHTPENDSVLAAHHYSKSGISQGRGPISPGSTLSGSSNVATPAYVMSRTEARLQHEKFLADMEDAAALNPSFPPHKFDRRNESLKSYLSLATLQSDGRAGPSTNSGLSMGPEIFQGRFKAVNTELKVVQKFHDPIANSIARLQKCKDSMPSKRLAQKSSPQKVSGTKLTSSKSAVTLSKQLAGATNLSTSISPAKNASPPGASVLASSKSTTNIKNADKQSGAANSTGGSGTRVAFSRVPTEINEGARNPSEGRTADAIARSLWDAI